uniref:Uncharacterized protein n=1 Tax=Cryptomonas curvata TaxID=233186 RepID=A0A7S0MQ86_9CRYP
MISKRIFQAIFAAASLYSAYLFADSLQVVERSGYFLDGVKRLRILELRGGGKPSKIGIAAAGIMQNNCQIPVANSPVITEGLGFTVNDTIALGAMPSNGYFFVTSDYDSASDPVRWVVETSADNGTTWTPIGASVWRFGSEGALELHQSLKYNTPTRDKAMNMLMNSTPGEATDPSDNAVLVDLRIPLSWILGSSVEKIVYALGFLSFAMAGPLGQAWCGKGLWIALLVEDAIVTSIGIAVVAVAEPWFWREAVKGWVYLALLVMLATGSGWFEQHFIAVLLVYCLLIFISISACEITLYQRELQQVLLEQMASLTFFGLVFGLAAIYFRHLALRRAYKLVVADRCHYDSCWDVFCAEPAVKAALLSLRTEVNYTMAVQWPRTMKVPRQYQHPLPMTERNLMRQLGLVSSPLAFKICAGGLKEPVRCLDQLFVQAMRLNPILIDKVQAWALESRGCFPCQLPGNNVSFRRFADVPPELMNSIRWASVKSSHRAIEKLVRVYGQDVSRLVDLCRQCIVFDDAADIANCLRAIRTDPSVIVQRIKNRLDLEYNSSQSAGYRDVVLNLQISNEQTATLGVDRHVCEVQLIHRIFADLKNNEGHCRYVEFRNLRGE